MIDKFLLIWLIWLIGLGQSYMNPSDRQILVNFSRQLFLFTTNFSHQTAAPCNASLNALHKPACHNKHNRRELVFLIQNLLIKHTVSYL